MDFHIMLNENVFCDKLKTQIISGEALLDRRIQDENARVLLKNDANIWSDYNLELLRQLDHNFNKDYGSEYQKLLIMGY